MEKFSQVRGKSEVRDCTRVSINKIQSHPAEALEISAEVVIRSVARQASDEELPPLLMRHMPRSGVGTRGGGG